MRSIVSERRALHRHVLLQAGIDPGIPRDFQRQRQMMGREAELLQLPIYDPSPAVQDDDGAPLFVVGISPVGGDDPISG